VNRTIIRNAVAGTALVATAALAAPAYACVPAETGTAPASTPAGVEHASWAASNVKTAAQDPQTAAPTFAQVQAKVLKKLDARVGALQALRAKVAAGDRLTAARRASALSTIDAATAALSSLRSQVAADTTTEQIRADLTAFKTKHDPRSSARHGQCDGRHGQDPTSYAGRHRGDDGWGQRGGDARHASYHHDGDSRGAFGSAHR
jgi:hypothetical protein